MQTKIDSILVRKVLSVVDAGLVSGLGIQEPGKMCVEAAVCFAMGLPHSDNPPCVGSAVRAAKIQLNDSNWSSDKFRTKGMRLLAIAQLGSEKLDQEKFSKQLVKEVIRQIVPIALRAAASKHQQLEHKKELEEKAKECEKQPTKKSANAATAATAAAANAATYAAANAATYAAANAATYAAYAATYAAANAATAAATAATYAATNNMILVKMAEIMVDILKKMKSPGCEFLYLCD